MNKNEKLKLEQLIDELKIQEFGKNKPINLLEFLYNPYAFGANLYSFFNHPKIEQKLDKDDIFREFYSRQVTTPKGEVMSRPLDFLELIKRQQEKGTESELPELQPLMESLKEIV